MKDKHKKMILLTIQDLKDLGVIGRKKKGRRKKRRFINKINLQNQPENPYFKSQTFTNITNLDTENKRLQNEALSSEVAIRNSGLQNQNNIIRSHNGLIENSSSLQNKAFDDLQNSHDQFKKATIGAFTYLNHKTRFIGDAPMEQSRFINPGSNIDIGENNYQYDEDNIDVPAEGGSEDMIAEGTNKPEVETDASSVLSWDMNFDPTKATVETRYETQSDNHTPPASISTDDYQSLSNLKANTPIQTKKAQKLQKLYQDALELGMDDRDFTPNMTSMRAKMKHQETINELIDEYEEAGGSDMNVINSKSKKI